MASEKFCCPLPWAKHLKSPSENYLNGWVSCVSDWLELRKKFEHSKSLHFVGSRKRGNFGEIELAPLNDNDAVGLPPSPLSTATTEQQDVHSESIGIINASTPGIASHYVRFAHEKSGIQSTDGVPFIITSTYTLSCMYGRDRNKQNKIKQAEIREKELKGDNPACKKRRRLRCSRKIGCPAKIKLTEMIRFPDFKSNSYKKTSLNERSRALRDAIQSAKNLKAERRIYISLPSDEAHNNAHPITTLLENVEDDCPQESEQLVTVPSRNSPLRKIANTCREKLLILSDLICLSTNVDMLKQLNMQLELILECTRQNPPHNGDLTSNVETSVQLMKKRAADVRGVNRTGALPQRKRKKRVGAADETKKVAKKQRPQTVVVDDNFDIHETTQAIQLIPHD